MATLLFKLRNVPEDEAEEVRDLLDSAGIETYETSAGNWRISMPAIWVKDDDQMQLARSLLDEYQQDRYKRVRQEYEQMRQRGEARTLWQNFVESPVKVALYLFAVTVVLYLSLQLFLSLT